MMLATAFRERKDRWPDISPASFDPASMAERISEGNAPRLIVLDQSTEDQLVPMNQQDQLTANLANVTHSRSPTATGSPASTRPRGRKAP